MSALLVLVACSKRVEEPVSESRLVPAPLLASANAGPASDASPVSAPSELLTLPSSAYQASVFVDGDTIEVLTASAAYRFEPGKEPERRAIDLGFVRAITAKYYVYWQNGAIWREPRRAAGPREALQRVAAAPQRIASDPNGDAVAWLAHADSDRYSLQAPGKSGAKTLYTSPGSIDALTLIGDALYFVERPEGDAWRIGRVKLTGAPPSFTASNPGRWPAMLSGTQELVYYDGRGHDVQALSLDLQRERTVAKGLICSPLAAVSNVYCATTSGVFEVTAAATPRQLVSSQQVVASVAASDQRLAFIVDTGSRGRDQLTVKTLSLTPAAPVQGAPASP